MVTINEKHEQAMQWAEAAYVARRKGDFAGAQDLSRKAYDLEKDAAESLCDSLEEEPSRSVLFRSAATLALWCDKPNEAVWLVQIGLSGNPPESIASKLQEVGQRAANHARLAPDTPIPSDIPQPTTPSADAKSLSPQ